MSNEILYVQSSVMLYELGYLVKWIKAKSLHSYRLIPQCSLLRSQDVKQLSFLQKEAGPLQNCMHVSMK